MEFTIHNQVLLSVFLIAVALGGVANKTDFCTMGAVSDWVNMGDTGRLRAWLFAIAVALAGVLLLEATGAATLPTNTFPPYRTANFAWLRYVLGGAMFGIGMTLASGCGNKTCVRLGGGNLKSLVVLVIASAGAYLMLWTEFFETAFNSWLAPTTVDLARFGIQSQELGAVVGGMVGLENSVSLHLILGTVAALGLLVFVFKSEDFRGRFDNILGGAVVGLAVVAGWWITGGPMGDTVRYLLEPAKLSYVNFGVMALAGVIVGSFLYAIFAKRFRIEWFASGADFANHVAGGVLMGVGGVLSMGCTIGQGVTGVSTLALGSILAFGSIVFGSALTMKVQYYLLDEKG